MLIFADDSLIAALDDMDTNSFSREAMLKAYEESLDVIYKDVSTRKPWETQARQIYKQVAQKRISKDKKKNLLSFLIVYKLLIEPFHFAVDKYYLKCNAKSAITLAAAIQLYEKKHTKTPKDLQLLVKDKILKKIPMNLWTGKPFDIDWNKRVLSAQGSKQNFKIEYNF